MRAEVCALNNVSLDETLFYQYMINNNSTSTMLNALNGSSSDDSSNSLTSAIGSMYSMNNLGTGSISDVSTILGLLGNNYSGVSSLDSFSSILQTYLNQDSSQAAEMMEKLEGVLEETAGTTEEGTKSWKTVQELYEYFAEMTSGQANNLLGILSPLSMKELSSKKETSSEEPQSAMGSAMIDFDAIEQESDTMIDSLMEETGYQF